MTTATITETTRIRIPWDCSGPNGAPTRRSVVTLSGIPRDVVAQHITGTFYATVDDAIRNALVDQAGGTRGNNGYRRAEIEILPDEQPSTTRIRVRWGNFSNRDTVQVSEVTVKAAAEDILDGVAGDAIRSALITQVGATSATNGFDSGSIEILPGEEQDRSETDSETALREQRDAAIDELADFKVKVVEVGQKYADRHGWCSVYDEVLSDLGLEKPGAKAQEFEVTVTLKVTATRNPRNPHGRDLRGLMTGETFIRNSIRPHVLRGAIKDTAPNLLDRDWVADKTEIEMGDVSVANVREVA